MKRTFLCILFATLSIGTTFSQVDEDWLIPDGWIDQSNFNRFKNESKRQFYNYRDSINRRFAEVLARQWASVEPQKPVKRTLKPDPVVAPVAPKERPQRKPIEIPAKLSSEIQFPKDDIVAPKPHVDAPKLPLPDVNVTADFLFYGTKLSIVAPDREQLDKCHLDDISEQSVAGFWQQLTDLQFYDFAAAILEIKKEYHLDTWSTYLAIKHYAATLFPNSSDEQTIAIIYLMVQMDYDAFIARTDDGLAMLLCSRETIYNTTYVKIYADDQRQTSHYLFFANNKSSNYSGKIYTYSSPFESEEASHFEWIFHEQVLPLVENKPSSKGYNYKSKGNNIDFSCNENLMRYLDDYPLTEFSVYANFPVSEEFANMVDHDFQFLVAGYDTMAALQNLLTYMQYGFDYATDGDQFGHEKIFFCEENFYYPQNDCEDRAILFSYLVRRLLGLNVVLLQYEDHVATAVQLHNQTDGYYIEYEGNTFFICDPTYIGASIGQIPAEYTKAEAQMILCKPIKR